MTGPALQAEVVATVRDALAATELEWSDLGGGRFIV